MSPSNILMSSIDRWYLIEAKLFTLQICQEISHNSRANKTIHLNFETLLSINTQNSPLPFRLVPLHQIPHPQRPPYPNLPLLSLLLVRPLLLPCRILLPGLTNLLTFILRFGS